ncbi:MAG: PRC-barrel domain-containing protein [Rhodospirillales bacterium]|nr:PRC-barrel domain-containing protein [Rhodospirillales bacterium]
MYKFRHSLCALLLLAGAGQALAQGSAPATGPAAYSLRATDYVGRSVQGRDGEALGTIEDLVIGQDRRAVHAIVAVGGFLGIQGRLIAVPIADLALSGPKQYRLALTREQVAAQPAFEWPAGSETSRDQYAAAAKLQIQEWELKMRDMAAKAKEKTEAGSAQAATKAASAWENVKKQWNALSDSTAEKWDATKRGFELAWQDFQREWEKAGN